MSASTQKPLGTGFDGKTAAADVMKDADLSGKTAIVTGGYSGIGLETAKALAGAGAEVIVPVRDRKKAEENLAEEGVKAAIYEMDLANLASVQEFAADVAGSHDKVHLLINNAGVMGLPETRIGPGWEGQFAINHIGHFVLTKELAPYLKNAGGARVVCLSSLGHKRSPVHFDDIHYENRPYDKMEAYGQSKTANALFALELNRRMKNDGVQAFSVHPGVVMTQLSRYVDQEDMIAAGFFDKDGNVVEGLRDILKTPEQGCATTLWCATSELLADRGGEYCEDCDIALLGDEKSPRFAHVMPWAVDDEAARRLWDETEKMVLSA